MFTNKMLIKISGVSPRTFYRRLSIARGKGLLEFKQDYYIDTDEARQYAEQIGFKEQFENHLKKDLK